MPIMVSAGESTFTPCPAGLHQAVCVDVVDHGIVETSFGSKHKISLRWQTSERMSDGRPYLVTKRYTASLHEKSVLRHDLESWRGRPFTLDELRGFDIEKLLGANCQVVVVHKQGQQGQTWANVQTIAPLARGQAKLEPSNYTRERDRTGTTQDPDDDTSGGTAPEDDIPFAERGWL